MTKRLLPVVLLCAACTDASLYGNNYLPNQANRIGFEGSLCTDDPGAIAFPQKTVIVLDGTGAMAEGDPAGKRFATLKAFVGRHRGPNQGIALLLLGANARPMFPGFSSDPLVIDPAIEALSAQAAQAQRNYLDALRMASTIIEDDLLAQNPGVRSRTRYSVLFVAAGPPDPAMPIPWCIAQELVPGSTKCADEFTRSFCGNVTPAPTDCERFVYGDTVGQLRTYVRDNNGQDLIFHTFSLSADARAKAILTDMARAGLGEYVEQVPATLDFLAVDVSRPGSRLVLREIVVMNGNSLLRGESPVPDSDGDALSDAEETELGTDPLEPDTDGDSVGDGIEKRLAAPGGQFDPLVAGAFRECATLDDPTADHDLDGLTDCEEAVLRTDPYLVDSDKDGVPDLVEVRLGGNPLVDDRLVDSDQDGIPNGEEVKSGLDPWTNDGKRDLAFAYQYRTQDQGETHRLEATPSEPFAGIRIISSKQGISSVWALRLVHSVPPVIVFAENEQVLPDDAQNDPSMVMVIGAAGEYVLPSPMGGELTVEADPEAMAAPGSDSEDARIILRNTLRTCFHMDVRNITLVETAELPGGRPGRGWNTLRVYVGEAPLDSPNGNTIVKAMTYPVRYLAPKTKVPNAAFVKVQDDNLLLLAPE